MDKKNVCATRELSSIYEELGRNKPLHFGADEFANKVLLSINSDSRVEQLLGISIIKIIACNKETYLAHCQKVINGDTTLNLFHILCDRDDKFVMVCIRDCLVCILRSNFQLELKFTMLKELQQVIENNKLPPDCRSTAMEVFIKLLSKDSQNQCEDVDTEVINLILSTWKSMIKIYIPGVKSVSEVDSNLYVTTCFLNLWKKIIKRIPKYFSSTAKKSDISFYFKSYDALLENIKKFPPDCLCKVLDILARSLATEMVIQNYDFPFMILNFMMKNSLQEFIMTVKTKDGFLGSRSILNTSNTSTSSQVMKKYVILTLKLCHVCCDKRTEKRALSMTMVNKEELVIKSLLLLQSHIGSPLSDSIPKLFQEQDDRLVEAMFYLLNIYLRLTCNLGQKSAENECEIPAESKRIKTDSDCLDVLKLCNDINPHVVFLNFLQNTTWDHSLILDYIISSETIFLQYFLQYLKYIVANWVQLISTCQSFTLLEMCRINDENNTHLCSNEVTSDSESCTSEDCKKYTSSSVLEGTLLDQSSASSNNSYSLSGSINKQESNGDDNLAEPDQMTDSVSISRGSSSIQESLKIKSDSAESIAVLKSNLDTKKTESDSEKDLDLSSSIRSLVHYSDSSSEDLVETSSECSLFEEEKQVNIGESDSKNESEIDLGKTAVLDRCMSVIIRLGLKIERMISLNIFPFQAKPLLDLLNKCESLYEI